MFRALTGCAVAASATLVLAAAPTLADSRSVDDGTGDVWTTTLGGDTQPFGERDNVDLVSTKVNHTATELVATATYHDLVRNTDGIEYAVLLKRPDGKQFWALFLATPDDRNGVVRLTRPSGKNVRCDGKSKSVSYADNELSFTIPRSCLGKPRWVRYESAAIGFDDADNYFIDDAASDQAEPSTWSEKLHQG